MITGQQLSITEKINNLRSLRPNKGKNMNVTPNTNTVDAPFDVDHNFYIDAEGNRVKIPIRTDGPDGGQTYSDSEASPEETTVYIAEDAADHPVTVH